MIKITDYAGLKENASVLEYALKELGLNDVEVIVQYNERLLDKYKDGSMKAEGLVHQLSLPTPTFNLFLRKDTDKPLPFLLCHEAVHVSQYVNNNLAINLEEQYFTWKGKKYDFSYEYRKRPWEQEAFEMEAILYNKYRKANRKGLFGWLKCSKQ